MKKKEVMETKVCSKCGEEKDVSKFPFRKDRNMYTSYCQLCAYKLSKKYYINNIEKLEAYKKEWVENNRDKIHKQSKMRKQRNPEKYHAAVAKKRADNLDSIRIYQANWKKADRKKNPERHRKIEKKYINTHKESVKQRLKKYYTENKEKLIKQALKRDKKNSMDLTDGFIAQKLRIPIIDLRQYPELIETKRVQLQIIRKLKELENN